LVGDHVYGLLLVDAATGLPVTLDYGLATTRTGTTGQPLSSVSVDFGGRTIPKQVRAYLMVDTYPAAMATLTAQ
jgi:hypothetical protein